MKVIVGKLSNAFEPQKQWFVFRATYGRETKAFEIISQDAIEAFLPMHYTRKVVDGKIVRVKEPLLPNIIFVHCDETKAKELVKNNPKLSSFLHFYYNHLKTNADGTNPPLAIDDATMQNFMKAVSVDSEHIKVVNPLHCHYKSGDLVRVTNGAFAGVVGRVARVSGQQRVIIEVDELCAIATAYIPTSFIVKV